VTGVQTCALPISDGLALSSRNQYLDADQRRQAACLHLALEECRRRFAAGMRDPRELAAAMRALIARHPAARPDYIEIVDNETLAPLTGPIVRPALAALAVRVGAPRLIDNTVLTP
jgi:pantothenate synthetase